jgi:hypothetical protein
MGIEEEYDEWAGFSNLSKIWHNQMSTSSSSSSADPFIEAVNSVIEYRNTARSFTIIPSDEKDKKKKPSVIIEQQENKNKNSNLETNSIFSELILRSLK